MNAGQARAQVLPRRDALPAEARAALSRQVTDRFLKECGLVPQQWRGLRVALYRALTHELDLRPLEAQLAGWGTRLCFPRVLDAKTREMEMATAQVSGEDPSSAPSWPLGSFGIEEPPRHHPAVQATEIDLIFVPGVAFGLKGERIGMGAGFYDRYLPQTARALRVALAFDFQLVPSLDQHDWDQSMHWIWTERRGIVLKKWTP